MATAVLPESAILSDENSFCLLCSANQEGISSCTCKKPEKKIKELYNADSKTGSTSS